MCLPLLAWALAAPAARADDEDVGEKHALLIGVKDYPKGELRNLYFAEQDVEGLAAALLETGYRRENVRILTQKAAAGDRTRTPTLANIRAALKAWLARSGEKDTLLLAFAGHGVQFRGSDEHFFCPADAKLADPDRTLLPVSEVAALLQRAKGRAKLLLVDACRNDPLIDMSRGAGGAKLPVVKLKSSFRPDRAQDGAAVALYSCARGQKAYEHEALKHSVYYHFVIQGLRGEADGNRDGKVTLGELYDYVDTNVPKFTRREFQVVQQPELAVLGGGLRGSIALALVKRNVEPEPRPKIQPERPLAQLQAALTLAGHRAVVWAVALSPNGRLAASVSKDSTLRLWDTTNGQTVRTLTAHKGDATAIAFSAGGGLVGSGGTDRFIRIWEVGTGKLVHTFGGHTGAVWSLAFSHDGKWAVSGSADKTVRLWELATRKERWKFVGHNGPVFTVAVSYDGWRIFSGGGDRTVRYWAVEKGKQEWYGTHGDTVWGVAISPDGKRGLSGSKDKTMRLWDLETGQLLHTFHHPNEVNGVAFSPDGRHAISTCDDRAVRIWSLATRQVVQTFTGHQNLVYSVAVARDGRTVLSGSFDNTARLWDLTQTAAAPTVAPEPPAVLLDRADLQVSVTWPTTADIDLHVYEPDGTKCFYNNRWTRNGGHLLRDVQDGTKGPEQYQAVQAKPGSYKVKLHCYALPQRTSTGQTPATQVTVIVRRLVGTPQVTTRRYTYTITRKDQVIDVCSVGF